MRTMFAAAVAAVLLGGGAAQATVITFDDIPGDFSAPANGYGGLDWNNFYVLNGDTYGASGYANGVVSHSNVAYNGFGAPASVSSATPFTLTAADLTGAWNDGLDVAITGYVGGVATYFKDVVVDTSGPTLVSFGWTGLSEVDFSSSGGVNHGYDGSGEHFAMDNLTISAGGVPEPTTWALMAVGAGLLGAGLRGRRREALA